MIRFLEEKHVYLNKEDKAYKSVTTVLKEFEPKKDWDKIKKNYAKKNGMSVQEVTDLWDGIKNKACNKGTNYHKFRELDLVSNQSVPHEGRDLIVYPSYCIGGEKHSTDSLILPDGVYPELIIWLDSSQIAGQADIVIVSDGKIHIQDYKTNKEIKRSGYVNWEKKEEKLLFPLDHLANCNYNTYSLQLSLYMYMLLRHNPTLKPGKMHLLHVQFEQSIENPSEELVRGIEEIEVPYRKVEVQNILNELKKKNK